ncbi:IS701 family transposase [Actinomadura sp. DC4]|uniref:IS701 family transposase n=1 Tax=Actinomadura sp. DC4 TaxID=3055069 RepID=UPI0025B1A328|nr:IS701 family transposase [Actinomadura sp. DC4]MDN3359682.1 IS701 family transposase [Actinomadura sp. DC4]
MYSQVLERDVSPADPACSAEPDPSHVVSSLYVQYRPVLLAYVTKMLSDPHQAEDVVQETMVRAWRNADRLAPERGSISAWLKRVAHNVAVDKLRARRARPPEVLVAEAPARTLPDHSANVVDSMFVRCALERLPPAQRAVLQEVYFADRTAAQAAKVLGVPVGTVKSRVHHALRNLRLHLEEQLVESLEPVDQQDGQKPAEAAGDPRPDTTQRLLNGGDWDPRLLRENLRGSVAERFGDTGGVLVVDETGSLKNGTRPAGFQGQHAGTAGRGVFLAYASARGQALIDAELYMPKSWTDDRARCEQAGIPANVEFATKPALAQAMIGRALAGGMTARWVTADETYGQGHKFRRYLEQRHLGYVVAVPRNQPLGGGDGNGLRPDEITADAPEQAWKRLSTDEGAGGSRPYDWAIATLPPHPDDAGAGEAFARWLLVRRSVLSRDETAESGPELVYYLCSGPAGTTLAELVRVAGTRSAIEDCFAAAKSEAGLGRHQGLRYDVWHRNVTLAMLAYARLDATAVRAPKAQAALASPAPRPSVSWQT